MYIQPPMPPSKPRPNVSGKVKKSSGEPRRYWNDGKLKRKGQKRNSKKQKEEILNELQRYEHIAKDGRIDDAEIMRHAKEATRLKGRTNKELGLEVISTGQDEEADEDRAVERAKLDKELFGIEGDDAAFLAECEEEEGNE